MAANAEATVTLSLIDRVTGPLKRISARLSALGNRLGFDRIAKATGRLGSSIAGLGQGLAASTGRLSAFLGLLGVGAGGAVATAFSLAQGAAELGDEVAKTARQLGLGAEALQEYRYAAKMSGVEQSLLDKGMLRFSANIADAAKGNKALAKDFAALGVRLKDTSGNFRSMDDIFTDAVEAISKLESPMERSRAAMKLFGRSGIDMTRLFEIGADGMRDLREEARRTGHVISQRAAEFSEVFGDNVERLQKRLEGLKLFVGVQLMPVFNDIVVALTEWFDANRQLVASTLGDWVKALSGFLRDLLDPASAVRESMRSMGETFSRVVDFIKPFVDFLGGPFSAALWTAAAWIVGPMVAALFTLGAAFVNLGIVIMSTPIGWILAGLAGLAGIVYIIYDEWDAFAAYWSGLWGRVTSAFDQGFIQGINTLLKEFNPVTHIVRGINAVIEYLTGVDLLEHGSKLIHSLTAGISAGAQNLGAFISEAVASAWRAYEEWWSGFSANVRAAGAAIVQALWDGLKSMWGSVVAWFKGAVADLVSWLPQSLQDELGFTVAADVTGPPPPSVGVSPPPTEGPGSPGAAVGAMVRPVASSIPRGASEAAATARGDANDNASTTGSGDINNEILTNSQNTTTVTAPFNVGGVTVNVQGMTQAEGQAMVERAISRSQARHAASVQSLLSD